MHSSNGHMLTHRNKKPYECKAEGCGKSYCDARSLRRHTENHHSGGPVSAPASTMSPAQGAAAGDAASPHGASCIQYAPPPAPTAAKSQLQQLLATDPVKVTIAPSEWSSRKPFVFLGERRRQQRRSYEATTWPHSPNHGANATPSPARRQIPDKNHRQTNLDRQGWESSPNPQCPTEQRKFLFGPCDFLFAVCSQT